MYDISLVKKKKFSIINVQNISFCNMTIGFKCYPYLQSFLLE